jgi:hypothetical protein
MSLLIPIIGKPDLDTRAVTSNSTSPHVYRSEALYACSVLSPP